jgi:hypothetical protein
VGLCNDERVTPDRPLSKAASWRILCFMLLSVGRKPIRLSSRIPVAHPILVDCVQAINGLKAQLTLRRAGYGLTVLHTPIK